VTQTAEGARARGGRGRVRGGSRAHADAWKAVGSHSSGRAARVCAGCTGGGRRLVTVYKPLVGAEAHIR
jgi:hypothetical protein